MFLKSIHSLIMKGWKVIIILIQKVDSFVIKLVYKFIFDRKRKKKNQNKIIIKSAKTLDDYTINIYI